MIFALLLTIRPSADAFPLLVDGRGNITIRSMSALSMQSTHPIELHTRVHAREGIHLPVSSSITFGSENRTSENRLEDREGDAIRLIGHGSATIQTGQTYVETRDGAIHVVVNKTEVAKATESSFDVGDLKVTGRVILPGESEVKAENLTIAASSKVSMVVGDVAGDGTSIVLDSSSARTSANLYVDGDVGVGTNDPGAKLHVRGEAVLQNGGNHGVLFFGDQLWLRSGEPGSYANRFFVDGTSGNVGVGTYSPKAKLHTNGNLAVDEQIQFNQYWQDGSFKSIRPGYAGQVKVERDDGKLYMALSSDAATAADEDISFGTMAVLTSSGKLGIGLDDPVSPIHIHSGSTNGLGASQPLITLTTGSPRYAAGLGTRHVVNQGQVLDFYTGDSGDNAAALGEDSIRLTILGNGNVGIGRTNPVTKLDVNSGTSSAERDATFAKFGNLNNNRYLTVGVRGGDDGNYRPALQSHHTSSDDNVWDILLNPSGGKVGVGTTDPETKLHINGNAGETRVLASSNGDGFPQFTVERSSGETFVDRRYTMFIGPNGNFNIKDETAVDAEGNERSVRVSIVPAGDVGIGTDDPHSRLHIEHTGSWQHAEYSPNGIVIYDRSVTHHPDITSALNEGQQLYMGADAENDVSYIQSTGDSNVRALSLNARGGNVGIGTAEPQERLHVDGNGQFSGNVHVSGNIIMGGEGTSNYAKHISGAFSVNMAVDGTTELLKIYFPSGDSSLWVELSYNCVYPGHLLSAWRTTALLRLNSLGQGDWEVVESLSHTHGYVEYNTSVSRIGQSLAYGIYAVPVNPPSAVLLGSFTWTVRGRVDNVDECNPTCT